MMLKMIKCIQERVEVIVMYHHYNRTHECRIMLLNMVNELIYTFTLLYRHLVSQLCFKLDCVASTGMTFEIVTPFCPISDFSNTVIIESIESSETSDDDWEEEEDDDLLDDDDDDDEEPDDKDLEDEDQDDLDDDERVPLGI